MTPLHIHFFQHVAFEDPAYIETWCKENRHQTSFTKWFESGSLPPIADIDWLVIMGGPMGVYDNEQYPWLDAEKNFIQQCINEGKIVIGICLGAQLIAAALGASVYPNNQKEIGWFPLELTEDGKQSYWFKGLPETFTVLHWHGDTFDLPAGARLLAQTSVCRNQAFSYQHNVLGLQFHFESTEKSLQQMIGHCGHELVKGNFIQTKEEIEAGAKYIPANNQWLTGILNQAALLTKIKV